MPEQPAGDVQTSLNGAAHAATDDFATKSSNGLNPKASKDMSGRPKEAKPAGQEVSLQEAVEMLSEMCGDLFIAPKRISKIDRVGAGAFATVDICELRSVDGDSVREVAVKRLRPECFTDKDTVKDFVLEVMVMARLQHSCIVQTLGVGAFGGGLNSANPAKLYTVQELMPGGDLNSVIMRQCIKPRIPVYTFAHALRWAQQIARGLRYLHHAEPQVIHRDMKFDNVLLTNPDLDVADAKLADFGLMVLAAKQTQMARNELKNAMLPEKPVGALSMLTTSRAEREADRYAAKRAEKEELAEQADPLTRLSMAPMRSASLFGVAQLRVGSKLVGLKGMLGSVPYIAPEIVKKQPYNEKIDMFAFGMMLYELFAKRLITFDMIKKGVWQDSAKFIHVAAQQVADGFRPDFPPNFPSEIRPLVESCWSEDPKKRLSADDVYTRLKEIEDEGSLAKYDEAQKLGGKRSSMIGGTKSQSVEVVGCQCVIC